MSAKLVPGKVYLKNTRTGRVYPYDPILAGIANMESFTAPPTKAKATRDDKPEAKTVTDERTEVKDAEVRGANGSVETPDVVADSEVPTANKLAEATTPVDQKPVEAVKTVTPPKAAPVKPTPTRAVPPKPAPKN